jgi:ATP-dependent protease La (LON) substrate-binding domain
MHDELLPLFPLAVVLLPHNELPLHIFEDRYKAMLADVMPGGLEFGVVLAAGQGLMPVGCTATVESVLQEYPDGRLDIITLGRRRFTFDGIDSEREYLRAPVSYFDDDDPVANVDLRRRAVQACEHLPWPSDAGIAQVDVNSPQLSFHLAQHVVDLDFRQKFLAMRSESQRLLRLIEYVPGYVEHAGRSERLKENAPKNGHGKLPPGFVKGV